MLKDRVLSDRVADLMRPVGEEELLHVRFPTARVRIHPRAALGAVLVVLVLVLGVLIQSGRDPGVTHDGLVHAEVRPVTTSHGAQSHSAPAEGAQARGAEARAAKARSAEAHGAEGESASDGVPPPAASGRSDMAAPGSIVVSVAGAVHQPGVVQLSSTPEAPARVADALQVARLREDANITHLNQAAVVHDGQHIIVPALGDPEPPWVNPDGINPDGINPGGMNPGGTSPGALADAGTGTSVTGQGSQDPGRGGGVNINTAGSAELTTLPGVGEKTAQAIVEYRTTHGPFRQVDDLRQIKGIGSAKIARWEGLIVL